MKYKELLNFNSLFEDSPSLALLHIQNDFKKIEDALAFTALRNSGTLKSVDFNEIDCDKFRLRTRDYEYAVLTNTLKNCSNKQKFMQTVYHSLENSSEIILIEQKEHSKLSEIISLLDEANYRAINNIDIFENHYLVMGKKLHMWGGGL